MDLQYTCTSCSMQYCITETACPFCDAVGPFYQPKRSISKFTCVGCQFENDLSNTTCVACDRPLHEDPQQKQKCQHCGEMVFKRLFEEHSTNCLLSLELIKQHKIQQEALREMEQYNNSAVRCKHCSIMYPLDLINDHYEVCDKKPKPIPKPYVAPVVKPVKPKPVRPISGPFLRCPVAGYQPPAVIEPYQQIQVNTDIKMEELFEQDEIKRLTKIQRNAILHMQTRSMKQHTKVQKQLQDRAKRLGFKKQDIQNLLFYIENYAPIIIHIHITKHMQFFVKDTHYRNQFETGKSSGSLSRQSRTQWEDRMFDKKYSSATDTERVKYGVINFTNDPKGVNCALGYGISYFLLKQHVRNRCTMTDMDSSSATSLIGTFKYCFHILNKMNDQQLKSAFNAAKALEQSSSVTTTYKQIQIHGPIQFAKDIQRVYVNKKEVQDKKYLDMVYAFCQANKIEYQFI